MDVLPKKTSALHVYLYAFVQYFRVSLLCVLLSWLSASIEAIFALDNERTIRIRELSWCSFDSLVSWLQLLYLTLFEITSEKKDGRRKVKTELGEHHEQLV